MSETALDNAVKHFGKTLGARIYACAMLQEEKMHKDGMTTEDYVRFTVGMVKRMRRQAVESGQSMTWENAVERLEMEQVEGRHYAFKSTLSRVYEFQVSMEADRQAWYEVETFRKSILAKTSMWSVKVEEEAKRLEEAMSDKAVDASDVAIMLTSIMSKWTARRRVWFNKVLDGLRNGAELTKSQRATITGDYAPKGVTASEFVELAVRYA